MDISNKEKEVAERLEKEREVVKDRLSMSRTSSRTGFERSPLTRTPPPHSGASSPKPAGGPPNNDPHPPQNQQQPQAPKPSLVPSVRPSLSFASAAARKGGEEKKPEVGGAEVDEEEVDKVVEVTGV